MTRGRRLVALVAQSIPCICLLGTGASAATLRTLYSFAGGSDGLAPQSAPAIGANGVLYGTTVEGGNTQCASPFGCGTVFALTPPASYGESWTKTIVWGFGGPGDGVAPTGELTVGSGGVLYGVTEAGGGGACADGCGVVFALSPPAQAGGSWTEAVLYSFAGGTDGAGPASNIAIGPGGVLYGATAGGGTAGAGTVYALTPPISEGGTWTETILHSFAGGLDDGEAPTSVVLGKDGVLYGTTVGGGSMTNAGTVFSLSPTPAAPSGWGEKVLVRFAGYWAKSDAECPLTNIVIGSGGTLYGTTGSIPSAFSVLPPSTVGGSWTEAILNSSYSLGRPEGNIVLSAKTGTIYGTSATGGGSSPICGDVGCGTVWSLSPPTTEGGAWVLTILHSFEGTDGGGPVGGISERSSVLYGTTAGGGAYNAGTVFQLAP